MIAARGVTVTAGRRKLLDDVTLTLPPGEILAVIGPNGAGKSTLLRVLAGELRAAGEAWLAGRPVGGWTPIELARRRAVVTQHVGIAFPLAVSEVVGLGRLPWFGTPAMRSDKTAVQRALDEVGVGHLAHRRYTTLSGGERQRVQIARALAQIDGVADQAALLLDEPTASLDPGHVSAVLRSLRRLARAGSVAILIVLHDLNEAAFVADRVALLAAGRLLALGPPAAVLLPTVVEPVYGVAFRSLPGGGLLPAHDRPAPEPDLLR